jgi:hypothetical protein
MKYNLIKKLDTTVKTCIKCKYFIKHWPHYSDEPQDNSNYGRCQLYGNIDLVTGDKTYDYAKIIRNDESKCGLSGKLFEKNNV